MLHFSTIIIPTTFFWGHLQTNLHFTLETALLIMKTGSILPITSQLLAMANAMHKLREEEYSRGKKLTFSLWLCLWDSNTDDAVIGIALAGSCLLGACICSSSLFEKTTTNVTVASGMLHEMNLHVFLRDLGFRAVEFWETLALVFVVEAVIVYLSSLVMEWWGFDVGDRKSVV